MWKASERAAGRTVVEAALREASEDRLGAALIRPGDSVIIKMRGSLEQAGWNRADYAPQALQEVVSEAFFYATVQPQEENNINISINISEENDHENYTEGWFR